MEKTLIRKTAKSKTIIINPKAVLKIPSKIFLKFKKLDRTYFTPLAILIAGAMISLAIIAPKQTKTENALTPSSLTNAAAFPSAKPTYESPQVTPLQQGDHIRGNKNNRFLLIEYSDLECPYCKQLHPTLKRIATEYSNNTSWIYRHFPIDALHPKAKKEAEAAECVASLAGEGAFWNFVDKVFEITPSNNGLNASQLPIIAAQVGANSGSIQTCIDSSQMQQKVESQFQDGVRIGVNATPTTVIYDTKSGKFNLLPGAFPYEQLKSQIDTFIKSASAS